MDTNYLQLLQAAAARGASTEFLRPGLTELRPDCVEDVRNSHLFTVRKDPPAGTTSFGCNVFEHLGPQITFLLLVHTTIVRDLQFAI